MVDFFKESNYPASFQRLLLNETLKSTYRTDFSQGQAKVIVNARKPHQTILGMMNLLTQVVDFIYNNAPKYASFKELYKDAQTYFKRFVTQTEIVNIKNVDTLGKGSWIRFNSQYNDHKNFEQNVANLKSLIADTPWCTSTLASTHLSEGDFYVFIDNNKKPHIAVKMNGNAIDEVRGIKNGNNQELENEYRDVVINFLKNNYKIEYGKEWLDKEEWNARLIQYAKDIDENNLKFENIPCLFNDLFKVDSKSHGGNSNLALLRSKLVYIKPQLAEYYNCLENEICVSDYVPKDQEVCPYTFIMGNANLKKCINLGNLQTIGGDVYFINSQITELKNLKLIGGSAIFSGSGITSLGNLKTIGGDAYFDASQITDLGNLQTIGRDANFCDSRITSLGNLQTIGGDAYFDANTIKKADNLKHVGTINLLQNDNETTITLKEFKKDIEANRDNISQIMQI